MTDFYSDISLTMYRNDLEKMMFDYDDTEQISNFVSQGRSLVKNDMINIIWKQVNNWGLDEDVTAYIENYLNEHDIKNVLLILNENDTTEEIQIGDDEQLIAFSPKIKKSFVYMN